MANEFQTTVDRARKAFSSGVTKKIEFRKRQLLGLIKFLDENVDEICGALKKDLSRSEFEGYVFDVHVAREEVIKALREIDAWAKPEKVKGDLILSMCNLYIRKEPFGVCLIIGAWNFPVLLLLSPLVGAIAAGNCVVLKPSEVASHSAEMMARLLPKYLDNDCYPVVVTGAVGSATLLRENRFDLIFYTGGTAVGKMVMAAATENLTPVVLELGGKNPCIIHRSSNLKLAAKRVCYGRFVNSGQVCLCPDYVLCEENIRDEFLEMLKMEIKNFFGANPRESDSYGRIINDRHFSRVESLLQSGKAVIGGQTNATERYIAPTVLIDVKEDSRIMQEEIFGPILPVLSVKNMDEAISFVNKRERPLALYIFSRDKKVNETILNATSSGGVCINDCLMQHNSFLPFGGIGHSGMGNYHGKYSFDTFSHKRSCLEQGTPEMMIGIRYPPYTEKTLNFFKGMKKKIPGQSGRLKRFFKLAILGILIAYLFKVLKFSW